MPLLPRLRSFWRSLFDRRRLDRELDEEVRGYADALAERYARAGLDHSAARRAASLDMGGLLQVQEQTRDARIGSALDALQRDARYAWRSLRRDPGFTLVAVLTLALGIGATAAIFSVVHAMLVEPLPYRDASRLVFVWADMSDAGWARAPLSGPELNDLRERGTRFAGFGAIWANTAALDGDAERDAEQLRVGLATTNFFSVLGADAAIGRTFVPEDGGPQAPPVILLGHSVWQRRYGADPRIVGRRILVNGRPTTVVGVMPADFALLLPPDAAVPDDLQAWLPFNERMPLTAPRGQRFLRVVGRLRPGVTVEQGRDQVTEIAAAISREFAEYGSAGRRFTLVGLHSDDVREMRPALLALLGGVLILLAIACVNVASLLVARAAARSHETALRVALGAGAGRLFRSCLAEGLLLAALGGAAGLVVGRWTLGAILLTRPDALRRIGGAHIEPATLAFTAAAALFCGAFFSLAPLVELGRANLYAALQRRGRQTGGAIHYRTRATLVVVQMALSVVLVVGAALLVRTFLQLMEFDPGFRTDGLLSFRLALPASRYGAPDAANAFARRLQSELRSIDGVTAAGAVSHLPYDDLPNWGGPYTSEPGADDSTARSGDYRAVSPGFLEAIGAHLVAGRFFTEADDVGSRPVVIVDDKLARLTWPGADPIGQRLATDPRSTGHATVWATVVGVVRHLRHRTLFEDMSEQVYFPERQIIRNPVAYVVRTSGDPARLAGAVNGAVKRLDPALPIYDVRPLSAYVEGARAARRFTMTLAFAFAAIALLMASVGVYGVIAYAVARRRYEFGVRLALGARPHQLTRIVVEEGVRLAALGLLFGLAAAGLAARSLRTQLFGVSPGDLPSYVVAIPVLGIAALLACWLPARRAGAISPVEALRSE